MTATAPYSALERTLSVLLSPLEHPTWQSWQAAVSAQLIDLTHADTLCIHTPLATGADAWHAPHLSSDALAQYAAYAANNPEWDIIETGFTAHAASTGRRVAHESEFISTRVRKTSAFHREFLAPHGLNDITVAGASIGSAMESRLHFANRTWRGEEANSTRQQLVRAVLPAYRSGLTMWRQLGQRRAELAYVFDAISDAVMLFDAEGTLVHANPSAVQLLGANGSASPLDTERLRGEAALVARRINALLRHTGVGAPTITPSSASRDVRTAFGTISLRGALAPTWMFGRHHGVIVTLERQVECALSDTEIRARFGFTARELEVARLVAEGLSNQALAERLGVSFFTARNHVERVLTKMGAHGRAQVGALLRAEGTSRAAAEFAA